MADPYESEPQPLPKLGSLAQSARSKQLRQARIILIVIGVLLAAVHIAEMFGLRSQMKAAIDQEVQKVRARGQQVDPVRVQELEDRAVRVGIAVDVFVVGLGVLFVIFGIMIYKYPVPITITGLVLYVGLQAITAVLDPTFLVKGIIVKIIIVVALIKAVQAAVAAKREAEAESAVELEQA
jgi:hypothetical protein